MFNGNFAIEKQEPISFRDSFDELFYGRTEISNKADDLKYVANEYFI